MKSLKAQLDASNARIEEITSENPEYGSQSCDLKSKPTLGYWNIRGLAQQIRYLFSHLNVEFDEKLYN